MRIILSPAKKMNENPDTIEPLGIPEYVNQTEEILLWLRNQTHEELQKRNIQSVLKSISSKKTDT